MFGSTKKKHVFDSYSMPLLVNNDVYKEYESNSSEVGRTPWPSLIQQTVSSSIVQNRNIGRDLIDNLVNGVYTKSRAMYSYGRRGEDPNVEGGYVRGLPTGKVVFIPSGSTEKVRVRIQKEVGQPIYIESCVFDEEDDGLLWYEAKYYLLDNKGSITGSLQTWRYRENDNTYPELSVDVKKEDAVSPYYPIIPIREYNQQISQTDPDLYRTGKQALRLIGLKYDDLDEAVHDNENTDLGFLDHCYVIIAVDIATQIPNSNIYLFEYFKKLEQESQVTKADWDYWQEIINQPDPENEKYVPPPPPSNRIEVSDGNYKMVMGWFYIESTIKTGSVTKVNQVKKFISTGSDTVFSEYDFNNDTLVLQKQFSETQYEEIKIHGLVHTNYIGTAGKTIRTTLTEAMTVDSINDKNNFIIPLRIDVMKEMGSIKGHDLMNDSVRMVFNSHEVQKLKWYQTGIFKVVVVVVAVAIAVVTAGTGTTAIPYLSAAMAGVAITTAITTIVLMTITPHVLKALEDLLGPEVALIIAIAVIYFTADVSSSGITTTTHVNAATTAIGGAHKIHITNEIEDIQQALEILDEELQDLEAAEAERIADSVWAVRNVDATSHYLMQPNAFIKRTQLEPSISIDLAESTHNFIDRMQFIDKPYSHIKLGLKPYGG